MTVKGGQVTAKSLSIILLVIGFLFIVLRVTYESIYTQSFLLAGLLAIIVGGIALYKVTYS
jgi:hypothetical protein